MAGEEQIKQLDHRVSDGIDVTMNYLPGQEPPIQIDVLDTRNSHSFSFKVAGGFAMDAFLHPFSHASKQGVETQPVEQARAA